MSKDKNRYRSTLYYVTLSVLMSLFAMAALTQGKTHGATEPDVHREL